MKWYIRNKVYGGKKTIINILNLKIFASHNEMKIQHLKIYGWKVYE